MAQKQAFLISFGCLIFFAFCAFLPPKMIFPFRMGDPVRKTGEYPGEIYFYSLAAGAYKATRKMILLN